MSDLLACTLRTPIVWVEAVRQRLLGLALQLMPIYYHVLGFNYIVKLRGFLWTKFLICDYSKPLRTIIFQSVLGFKSPTIIFIGRGTFNSAMSPLFALF
jgi:hypothetical protein